MYSFLFKYFMEWIHSQIKVLSFRYWLAFSLFVSISFHCFFLHVCVLEVRCTIKINLRFINSRKKCSNAFPSHEISLVFLFIHRHVQCTGKWFTAFHFVFFLLLFLISIISFQCWVYRSVQLINFEEMLLLLFFFFSYQLILFIHSSRSYHLVVM